MSPEIVLVVEFNGELHAGVFLQKLFVVPRVNGAERSVGFGYEVFSIDTLSL